MTDRRAVRLAELFERCIDLDAASRRRLLDAECREDAALRAEVERLLAADAGPAAAMLDTAFDERRLRAGDVVAGRYRVIRKVGEGGMGVVFEAEQLEPHRRVALKCIRSGWIDAESLQRFRREAQALGRLQHPGIAQVYEAGVTDGDPPVPFLAMEFVDGKGLLEYAEGLSLRARLELLAQIAEAVGHAHERGVVHRDIKPSNILVEVGSAGPRPRVLDFGVARFAEGDAALSTRTHQIVGTLAYLSPEQLSRGSSIADPRSDVWSLGVTAYQLLAGRLPLALGELSLPDAALLLRDTEPVHLDRLVPGLHGDAATIVHKALEKDPGRRYSDARALAADLRRFLAAEPITARPASAFYLASRLVARHRGLFAGLAATVIALAGGLVVSIVFATQAASDRDRANELATQEANARARAERRTDDLRTLVRTLVRDIDGELQKVPGTTAARRQLLEAGQRQAEAMAADAGDSADTLLEVASLFEVLSNVQGKPGTPNLGDLDGALRSLDRAIGLVDRAKRIAPDEMKFCTQRQRLLRGRDQLLRTLGKKDERLANLLDQQAEAKEIMRRWPGPEAERAEAFAAADLGRLQADLGQLDEALANFEHLREFLDRRIAALTPPKALAERGNLRVLLIHIGLLQDRRNDAAAARAALDRAVREGEALAVDDPGIGATRDLADTLRSHATHCIQHGDAAGSLVSLQRAHELIAPLAKAETANLDVQRLSGIIDFGVADALVQSGRTEEGLAAMRAYLEGMEKLVARYPQPQLSRDLLPGQQTLAEQLAKAGQFDEAEQVAGAAVTLAKKRVAAAPEQSMEQDDLLDSLGVAAFVFERSAQRPGLPEGKAGAARRRAADLLEEQLTTARKADAVHLLDPRRRSILDELPPRIAALRAGTH